MFQFTTTNVINSNTDVTTGKPLWSSQEAKENTPASFYVKRVNKFMGPNVVSIYKAEANDPQMAKVTLDLSQINGTDGESYRLSVYIGLTQASQESRYANDLILKGKPFTVDFVWKTSAAEVAKNLVKIIDKYAVMVYGEKLLNVSYSGVYLTIEAVNEYQRFRKVNIEKFDKEAYFGRGEYNVVRTLDNLTKKDSNAALTGIVEGYFVGKEGFGTYSYLLHNLRIPTPMRTRAFGVNLDENPIIGAKYNQYTIHYCTNRGVLGTNAVGDTVKSVTTHVFYVNQNVATDFEAALAKIGTVLAVAPGTKTPDPGTVNAETLSQEVAQLKTQVAAKQDKLTAGNGIDITGNTASVKIDGDTLTASANGLKVADGKFTEV